MVKVICAGCLLLTLILFFGCDSDSPTTGDHRPTTPLAGGGRYENNDPYGSGPDTSGWEFPDFDTAYGYPALYYAEFACGEPGHFLIEDSDAFADFWLAIDSCTATGWDSLVDPGDSTMYDSSVYDSVYPDDPYHWSPPAIDFDSSAVAVIILEDDSALGRSIQVTGVTTSEQGTSIRYTVSELDSSCAMMFALWVDGPTSPMIAVVIPKPITQPVSWIRADTVYSCSWGPDPSEPMTLYYTDAPCDLGAGETVIRDSATYARWLQTAWSCDSARWSYPDTIYIDSVTSDTIPIPGGGMENPWYAFGPPVDFSTHAVVILRAGAQHNWGGGVWLDWIESGATGTTIDYTVMVPTADCPPVDDAAGLNPTVAIRLPLPLINPITWRRSESSINCDWGPDTVRVWPED